MQTTSIDADVQPHMWSVSPHGLFAIDSGDTTGTATHWPTGNRVDAFHAAVASGSLPFVVGPSRLDGELFLDGGVVANLPAGHVLNHGSAGGFYVVCVIPRSIGELDPVEAIDRRVLEFLVCLRDKQAEQRNLGVAATAPYAFDPIFVVSPTVRLESTLVSFDPALLRREFEVGKREGAAFAVALAAFERGSNSAMDHYLLENLLQGVPPFKSKPKLGAWQLWVNTRW